MSQWLGVTLAKVMSLIVANSDQLCNTKYVWIPAFSRFVGRPQRMGHRHRNLLREPRHDPHGITRYISFFFSQNNWPLTSYQQTRRSLSGNWLAMMILTDTLNEFSTGTTTLSLMLSFLPTANSPCLPHGTTLFVFGILTLVSQRAVSSDTHPMFSQSASAPTTDKSSLDRAIRQSSFGILWASASMISKTTATPSG